MLEGLILGIFLMTAEQAAAPAAPVDATSTAAAADTTVPPSAPADPTAASTAPAETTAPAEAAPPAETAPAAQATNTNAHDANRVRCHRGPPEVGSIMGRRICTTHAQDRERAERDAAQLERMQRQQSGLGGALGN